MRLPCLFVSTVFLHFARGIEEFQSRCLGFAPQTTISNATLTVREYVTKGTNISLEDNDRSCNRPFQVAAANVCRVALSVPTSNRSSVTMELWIPEQWEGGRILTASNGGIDGCIPYENLAYGTEHGFVTVAANNGHNGTSGNAFLNNPDVIIDYAYRSLHTSIVQAKSLSKLFYNQTYKKSYFIGCSLGGRQGIGAADRYPNDFDGIIAGSPASDFNNLYAWRASFYPITGKNTSSDFIDAKKWVMIHDEVLRQCDTVDGVQDGIIEDPTLCNFKPETLLCPSPPIYGVQNTSSCLTPAQIAVVNKIHSPLYGTDDKLIYPAMQYGNELKANTGLFNGLPWQLSQDWYRGKTIAYHGLQDQQITSFQGIRFYDHLRRGMSKTPSELDDFYRFFRISGMFHCNAGPGAWVFGQGGSGSAAGIPFEAEENVLAAIVDWVEKGKAPEGITGTKFVEDDAAKGVSFKRRHCKYPSRNTYVGGDPGEVRSWGCRDV
ncbi:tannase and feruloyl esterase [Byssothecium circinans]|uniref:Carboxylic ester hydrolase n=1 Tax=Byssothecium circinans TaxID=147558 RepID=A0A6A5TND5_9PLEO|nr:tannase and feruloyl esterase [Byssothecium circinans]